MVAAEIQKRAQVILTANFANFKLVMLAQPMLKQYHPVKDYLFQVKHRCTHETDARRAVVSDFEKELKNNVLTRGGNASVNYFFLITNVSGSKDALEKLDKKPAEILKDYKNLHADIWWKEQVISFLDGMPNLCNSFSEMFAGGKVPFIANVGSEQK